jgi:hypothetical protein
MKRFVLLICLYLITVSPAAMADTDRPVPVEAIDGQRLQLHGVSAELNEHGLRTGGWVRRDPGNYGPVSAHLHVIALAADGAALQTVEARWQGNLPTGVRSRHSALFRAEVDPAIAASVARIRVSIEPGSRHAASQP